MNLSHTYYLAISECIKLAAMDGNNLTAIGMLCKMLEADTPYKLRKAWNEAYVVVERLVDTLIVQEIEDAIRGEE